MDGLARISHTIEATPRRRLLTKSSVLYVLVQYSSMGAVVTCSGRPLRLGLTLI